MPHGADQGVGAVLAHHYTSATVVTGVSLASVATYLGRFYVGGGILLAALLALAAGGPVRRRLSAGSDPGPDPETARALEELRLLYADGEVGHEEYERRHDAILERGPEALWADPPDPGDSENQ